MRAYVMFAYVMYVYVVTLYGMSVCCLSAHLISICVLVTTVFWLLSVRVRLLTKKQHDNSTTFKPTMRQCELDSTADLANSPVAKGTHTKKHI